MKHHAEGVIQFTFWGDDTAGIMCLVFDSPEAAADCVASFREASIGEKHDNALVVKLTNADLEAFKADMSPVGRVCTERGCKRKKTRHECDSLAHSIDHGPWFDVDVPVKVVVDKNQMALFAA